MRSKQIPYLAGILFFTCFFTSFLQAAPNNGDTIQLKQPDNSLVTVVVWGDEFYQHVESMDGYTLMRDPQTNWICYAQFNSTKLDFISTAVTYQDQRFSDNFLNTQLSDQQKNTLASLSKSLKLPGSSIQKKREATIEQLNKNNHVQTNKQNEFSNSSRSPLTGTIVGLTVLVDFSDQPATITKAEIENLLNQSGYNGYSNNGSVRDYFLEVSNGKLDYSNIVLGYYRAIKPKSYYDDSSSYAHVPELLGEVYSWVESQGFDFSTITINDISQMIAVNVFYAGTPQSGWAKGLWPHRWFYDSFSSNGISSHNYELTDIGSELNIGTICHENGHMLFNWPDLYDYGYDNFSSNGVGFYCLMAYGSFDKNPVPPNAWLRADAGWDSVMTFNSTYATYSHVANSGTSYKYLNPNYPGESFFIETRKKIGRNMKLPDQGMMIWHIDENVGGNESQQMTAAEHFEASILQADNFAHLENGLNYGNIGDLFKGTGVNACGDSTSPSTDWWFGDKSFLEITNISNIGDTMTFTVGILNYAIPETAANESQLIVYPNPTTGKVTIDLKKSEPAIACLYDLRGKQVYKKELSDLSNMLDISALANGVYVMKIVSKNNTGHYKLIKQ